MDLLGSILNAMDKPPAANEKEKEAIKSIYNISLWMKNYLLYLFHIFFVSTLPNRAT